MVFYSLILAQQLSIDRDPLFQSTLTLDQSIQPLPELIKGLASQFKVNIRSAQAINDLKIDIFVKDEKLGTVLAKLAEVINGEWTKDQSGYTLNMSVSARNHERNFVEAEDKLAMEKVDFDLDTYRLQASLVPPQKEPRIAADLLKYIKENPTGSGIMGGGGQTKFEKFKPELLKVRQELKNASQGRVSPSRTYDLRVREAALGELVEDDINLVRSRLFGLMSKQELTQFRSGIPFSISNLPDSKFTFSPGDRTNAMVAYRNGEVAPTTVLGLARVVPGTYEITYVEYSYAEGSTGRMGGQTRLFPFSVVPEELKKLNFYTNLQEWNQADSIASLFPQPLKPAATTSSPYSVKGFRFGDHMRWFHRSTGIPTIAVADRSMSKTYTLGSNAKTAGEYLSNLLQKESSYAHKSDNFLLARNNFHWRKRVYEIPENLIRAMEAKSPLTVQDYARFSTKINEQQARLLASTGGFLVAFPTRIFSQSMTPLQILGQLSDAQAKQVFTESGLPYTSMNGAQQNRMRFGMFEAMLQGASIEKDALFRIVKTGIGEYAFQNMSFRAKVNKDANILFGSSKRDGVELEPELRVDGKMLTFEFSEFGKPVVAFWGVGL